MGGVRIYKLGIPTLRAFLTLGTLQSEELRHALGAELGAEDFNFNKCTVLLEGEIVTRYLDDCGILRHVGAPNGYLAKGG